MQDTVDYRNALVPTIAKDVARRHRLTSEQVLSRFGNRPDQVQARHEMFYILLTHKRWTMSYIAKKIYGGMDHSSVGYGAQKHALLNGLEYPFRVGRRAMRAIARIENKQSAEERAQAA